MSVAMEPDFIVCPSGWPERHGARADPADIRTFVPQGLALVPPPIVTPYSEPASPAFYASQGTITHPVRSAPLNDDAGGVVYFSEHCDPAQIVQALDLFGFRTLETHYALFLATAEDPREENFLDKMRIVSYPALAHFFQIETGELKPQSRNLGAAMQRFMECQRYKWSGGGSDLAGVLGGDGDWAKERMAFGAMTENAYWGVWRIWSRAWLVTK